MNATRTLTVRVATLVATAGLLLTGCGSTTPDALVRRDVAPAAASDVTKPCTRQAAGTTAPPAEQAPADTADVPADEPAEAPAEAPVDAPADAPAEAPADAAPSDAADPGATTETPAAPDADASEAPAEEPAAPAEADQNK